MDPARWRQIDELYRLALQKPASERPAFLSQSCSADASLRHEVESLLAVTEDSDGSRAAAMRDISLQSSGTDKAGFRSGTPAPEKLGRYTLLDQLGKGGMGVVYRAVDPAIGRIVAIKTILLQEGDQQQASALRSRLFRESQAGGQLSHPNIVAVYDVSEQDDVAYIVMEYVEGRTLEKAIGGDPSLGSVSEALRITQECANALDYAHSRGIVHRDIKPANIMLQANGSVKIADFGIAKAAQFSALTQSATILGSPYYMAPEQWKGEPVTGRTDQYALATVAYALLTGRRPFECETMATLAAKALYEEAPAATSLNPALPAAVDDVFRRALCKSAGARYESCSQFAGALRSAHERATAVPPPPLSRTQPLPPPPEPSKSINPLAVVSVAAILATAGGGAWLYQRNSAAQAEVAYWTAIKDSKSSAPFAEYLSRYPEGQFADSAKAQLEALKNQRPTEPITTQPATEAKPLVKTNPTRTASTTKTADTSRRGTEPKQARPVNELQPPLAEADLLNTNGNLRMKEGNFDTALVFFSGAISIQPEYRSYFGRAGAYQHLERLDEAIQDYSQAIRLKPDAAMAYHERAVCQARLKRDDLAFADYNRALELAPNRPLSLNGRGVIYLHRKEYEKALSDFDKAILLAPDLAQAYKNRAIARRALGDASGAEADLKKAQGLKP